MGDLLDTLLTGSEADVARAEDHLISTLERGDTRAVGRAERTIEDNPEAITIDETGLATVTVGEHHYGGGRFDTPTLGELKALGGPTAGAVQLSVLEGASLLTDIGALQAWASESTVFQLASQFNCLESPGPYLVRVRDYLSDPTQGPRGAVSAFPATLVRHYTAPNGRGGTFRQTADRQLNLLAGALPESLGRVVSGYLQTQNFSDLAGAAEALESKFDQIRVGVHADAEVVLGAAWGGSVEGRPVIGQVCTSTLAAGGYSRQSSDTVAVQSICRQLLRAGYLGTLLAARRSGARRVVLTLIGGGVFANPHALIVDSIRWAVDEARSLPGGDLQVVLNARHLDPDVDRARLSSDCVDLDGVYRVLPS